MSYCVNCGVELDKSASKCVLCGCPVVNPYENGGAVHEKPYPDRIILPKTTRKRYAALLVTFILCIPNIICGLTNLFMPKTGVWSLYVILSSFLVWVIVILPFLLRKKNKYVLLGVDTVVVLGYLYSVIALNYRNGWTWFLKFALPLVLSLAAIILFMFIWLGRKKRSDISIVIAVLTQISAYCIVTDILLHLFYTIESRVYFSFIVTASCLVLIVMLIFAIRNERFKAWLERKFFV